MIKASNFWGGGYWGGRYCSQLLPEWTQMLTALSLECPSQVSSLTGTMGRAGRGGWARLARLGHAFQLGAQVNVALYGEGGVRNRNNCWRGGE